jgi:periplasmic divalent cation tolerance protein
MRIIYTTCPMDKAEELARKLLEERLVACANICAPVTSLYWWKGEIQREDEAAMIMKTRDDLVARVLARTKELHPYDVPAISAVAAEAVDPDYLKWVDEETNRA